jgi:hypothetical protein
MHTQDSTPPRWPGDPKSTTLRAAWHRQHQRIAELEKVSTALAYDLDRARAELAKIEAMARAGAPSTGDAA